MSCGVPSASFQGFFFQLWPENATKSYGFEVRLVGNSNNGRRREWNSKTQIRFPQWQRGCCLIAGLRNSVASGNGSPIRIDSNTDASQVSSCENFTPVSMATY